MVSLVEIAGSSFIYFLLFTMTLIALWLYVVFNRGTTQPLDPNVFKKDDSVKGKKASRSRSRNKRDSPQKKQGAQEQVGNKPKLPEAKSTPEVTKVTSAENTTNSTPQADVGRAPDKVEAAKNNSIVPSNTSGRSKQKGKKKITSKQEQQEEKDAPVSSDDVEGGWKVQLSRQQIRALKEQQRQIQHMSHDHQDEAVKEGIVNTSLNEKQSGNEDTAKVLTDKASDQNVEVSVHCDDPTGIERALKEAADTSSSPEVTETPLPWGSRRHKKTKQKGKPEPATDLLSDHIKDQSQEDWVIL